MIKLNGKSYVDKYYKLEETRKKYGGIEQNFTLSSEVKSLSNIAKVTFNKKTEKMIRKQKDSRR
jgi:ABC-type phosphate/phosphonate transport system ATPase subunit